MSRDIVVVTGANGVVAQKLEKLLYPKYEVRFLTRTPKRDNEFKWNIKEEKIDLAALENTSHIVHLAGANIFEKRWTDSRKDEIIASRVDSAQLILKALKNRSQKIKSFVSASAVGYYGAITSDVIFAENDNNGNDFLAEVVKKWERAADEFAMEEVAEKVVKLRSGVILSTNGGGFQKMVNPIKMGIGSPLGSGNQFVPWIHIDDFCKLIIFSIEDQNCSGVYNAVAPQHLSNKELTTAIANHIRKPLWMPNVPSFIIKILFGEASCMILEGSRVSSEKLQKTGFQFEFPNIKKALKDLLSSYKA